MNVGSLVKYAPDNSLVPGSWGTCFPQRTLAGLGEWKSVAPPGGFAFVWHRDDIGIIVDIIRGAHRKAIVMRENMFFAIALKHLKEVRKR